MPFPTVAEELRSLRARGFGADVSVTSEGFLHGNGCAVTSRLAAAVIESTARFEGASNPDDQAIVLGLCRDGCGVRGVLVAGYGPTATAEVAKVLTALALRPTA